MQDVVDLFKSNVEKIAEKYFVDISEETVGDKTINHYKTTLLGTSYMLGENTILWGEPGFGKTTVCKVMMSAFGGLPIDFYESVQVQGNAEQTEEKMKARPHFGKLMEGQEVVIWNRALYADAYLLDEISLLPKTKQDILLESIRTGRWNYLNGTLYFGKRPFYATSNYEENGKHNIDFRVRDRFAIAMEMGWLPLYDAEIAKAEENITNDLTDHELTTQIIEKLNDTNGNSLTDEERREYMLEEAEKFSKKTLRPLGLKRVDDDALQEFRQLAKKVPFTSYAGLYLDFLQCELNATQMYGMKRRNDLVDDSTHAKALASTKILGAGRTPRVARHLRDYSQAIALILGDKEVRRDHISAIAPYVLAHRLDFTDDFQGSFEDKARLRRADGVGENRQFDGTRRLLHDADKNWKTALPQLELLDKFLSEKLKKKKILSDKQRKDVQHIIDTIKKEPFKIDHPHVRLYAQKLIKDYKKHGV